MNRWKYVFLFFLLTICFSSCDRSPDAFYRAVTNGDVAWLETNVGEINVSRYYEGAKSPLHLAVEHNRLNVVVFLLSKQLVFAVAKVDKDLDTPLHLAAILGRDEMIPVLVKAGLNTEVRNLNSNTPVMEAVLHGHLSTTKTLIEAGAQLDVEDAQERSLLHLAAKKMSPDIMRLLAEQGAPIEAKDIRGFTPLHYAVLSGSEETAEALLKKGANPNSISTEGLPPLEYAIYNDNLSMASLLIRAGASTELDNSRYCGLFSESSFSGAGMVKLLLEHGANVNYSGDLSLSALHCAAGANNLEAATLLIQHRADVNVKCAGGITPLHSACLYGSTRVVMLLLSNNADATARTETGFSALDLVIRADGQFSSTDTILVSKMLLKFGAKVNEIQPKTGMPPLTIAVDKNKADIVELLLHNGADVNIRASTGETPLHLVKNPLIAEELLKHHADPNIHDNHGYTALHMAAMQGYVDLAKLLIANGADPNSMNNRGETPAEVALRNGHQDVATYLEQQMKH